MEVPLQEAGPTARRKTMLRLVAVILGAAALLVLGLFAWTGLRTGWREPAIERIKDAAPADWDGELTLVALNLAKLDFHRGLADFAPRDVLEDRALDVARALRTAEADIVCLSEIVKACGPVPFDQVQELAVQGGFSYHVYLPNYDFGVPGMRISAGNAVLSRFPLRAAHGQQLAGGRPFWAPTNNRRALWCEVRLGDTWVPLASIRNDSFDLANNAQQVGELLMELDGAPGVLAGDFNATPDSGPWEVWRGASQLAWLEDGSATYPAHGPMRRIDDAVWPRSWELVEEGTVGTRVSDHLGVFFRWRVPGS